MTDVLLQQTNDGGEIDFDTQGNILLTDDLRTSVYVSLFGGGGWWADIALPDSNDKLTGETGEIINSLPATVQNLLKLEDAVKRDLQWLLNIGAASSVEVNASLESNDRLTIVVNLEYDGQNVDLTYSLNWTS